jgi:hypothetical protein
LFIIFFLISIFIYFILIYPLFFTKTSFTKTISDITKLPNISYSTSFYEPQIKEYKDFSNTFYPQQKHLDYMGYIYEQ